MQVGLHHHREQGLVDPAAPFQQAGEERPDAQLRDPQLQIPGRGRIVADREPLRWVVRWSVRSYGPAPITAVSLGLDQRLIQRLRRLPDPISDLSGLQCVNNSSRAEWSKAIVRCVLP